MLDYDGIKISRPKASMESNAVACVITGNYIPHALILYRSLLQTNPGTRFIVLVLGEEDRLKAEIQEGPEWIFWSALYNEIERRELVEKYTAFELSCATRGRFHEYLYLKSGARKWIMLDTDMYILASLDPIWQSLEENTLILTPHSRNPYQDSGKQVDFIRSGIYNAGFLAFQKCPEALRAIRWFKERIEELGYASPHRQASGMQGDGYGCLFVDQIWLNFMPVFFAGVNSLGAPQWNLGHWNLEDGVLEKDESERYLFDGHQVIVGHFSSIDPKRPEYVSTHAPRYRERPNFTWAAMAATYLENLLRAREASAKIGYCYADQFAAARAAAAARQNDGPRSRKQQLRKTLSRLKQTASKPHRIVPRSLRGALRAGVMRPLLAIRDGQARIASAIFENKSTDNFLGIVKCIGTYEVYTVRTSIARHLRSACQHFHGSVLDVGAGSAPYRELITAQPAVSKYIRLDFADSTYHSGNELEMTWDGKVIGLPDDSIDSVLLTEVLEHVRHPDKLLAEIARVMKPGGFLFLTVPFIWPLHELPFDYYRYTPIAMRELLEEQGFTGIDIRMMGGWDTSLAQMLGLYLTNRPMRIRNRRLLQLAAWPLYNMLVKRSTTETTTLINHQMYTGLAAKARLGTQEAKTMVEALK